MRDENKKTAVITLTILALLIGITPWLGENLVLLGILSKEKGIWAFFWLDKINFRQWGWFLGYCAAIAALIGAIYWKPGSRLLRGIVIFFSVVALVLALTWLRELRFLSQFNW